MTAHSYDVWLLYSDSLKMDRYKRIDRLVNFQYAADYLKANADYIADKCEGTPLILEIRETGIEQAEIDSVTL